MPIDLARVRLHQLEGFFHVARHGGYARAVAALPHAITEPALHQQVRNLEGALGVRLLERAPRRRMALTAEGRRLHDFVTPYFERLDSVLRSVSTGAGLLVVGTEALYAEHLCPRAIASLEADWKEARFRLLEMDPPGMISGLLQGKLDAAVCSLGEKPPPGLVATELGVLGLVLVVPGDHPLAKRRGPIAPKHLTGHRFAVYEERSQARVFTEQALASVDVRLIPAAEASSGAALRALARAGIGPAFIPVLRTARPRRRQCADGTVELDLTTLAEAYVELPRYGLLTREGEPGRLLQAFRDAIAQGSRTAG